MVYQGPRGSGLFNFAAFLQSAMLMPRCQRTLRRFAGSESEQEAFAHEAGETGVDTDASEAELESVRRRG